jgi:hypothetical protein
MHEHNTSYLKSIYMYLNMYFSTNYSLPEIIN